MKYFNWQKLGINSNETRDDSFGNLPGNSLTDLHLQAWSLLCQSCNPYQLERLSLLAWHYETGKRVP